MECFYAAINAGVFLFSAELIKPQDCIFGDTVYTFMYYFTVNNRIKKSIAIFLNKFVMARGMIELFL